MNGKILNVEAEPKNSIKQVKEEIEKLTSVPASEQRLVYSVKSFLQLEDDHTLESYDVPSGKNVT